MAYLAFTRRGVESFLALGVPAEALWVAANALSDAEIEQLRKADLNLTAFTYPIEFEGDLESALSIIREHHPNENVYIEHTSLRPDGHGSVPCFMKRE